MKQKKEPRTPSPGAAPAELSPRQIIRLHVKEFAIPPTRDGLVLGKHAPIGSAAMRKALSLLVVAPFEHIAVRDDVVGDVLIREALLRRISRNRLVAFVLQHIKPLMGPEEILQLEMEVQILLEDQGL